MKIIVKRSLSMLMALVLIVSLFSGVVVPASAASYTYNWGYRGQTATSLSSAATSFYAKNNTSYEQLSSYTGSATLSSVPSSALYKQLQTLMKNNHSYQTSYAATRDMYKYTDCQNGGGRISSFYSGVEIGPDWDSGSTWNREHTWPNSKGLAGNDENDIMMLRPTATSENGSRSNTAYGISGGYYDPNMESGYTLNLHGDVARIFLYIYVRWGNVNGNGEYTTWGSRGVMESREVLLAWMEEDPVDTWELGRNDSVQSITGTRNVFVDYPELAFLMFGEEIPDTMPTPSGMAIAGAHDIQVSSNDTAMGTVSISGKNIQAYPAVGHKVVGYEVVSGTAEVTQNGNAFEVKASSDCEIKIIFAPKLLVEMTYRNNGQILSSSQVYDGDPVTLAAYTETAPANFTFLGWVDAPVSATETVPTYYKVGASYTVNGTTNMHALFSWVLRDDEGSRTCYTTSTCIHENTVDVKEKDADCTNNGYTAGVYCNDCESYITGHEDIGSLGHNHIAVVTPPTVTDAGYTTHTCDRCGDVYTSDPVPALGETYTVSFSVPADAASVEDMGCNTTGILLPEADDVEGHTFLGWVTASMEDTTEKPAILKAGDKFVATANTTLYALYTYMEGNTVAGDYVLVTSAGQLEAGTNVIIVASDYNYALSTTQNSNNRGQVAITKNGDAVDATAGMAVLELRAGAVAGTYAFYCPVNGGYLYAASNTSNQLKTQFALDANGSFLLTFDGNGICTATAQGTNSRNTLRYNKSSMFACYAATNTNQADISLYMEAPAGIAHYTTNIVHRHSGTYHAAAEATCQSAGNVVYYSCGCGLNFADSDCTQVLSNILIPRLDHSFTAETVDAKYLKTEANCQTAAVYYLSCVSCGISSNSDNAVFVSGDVNPDNHPGEGIFTGETPATCTENGVRGDIVCGECGGVMEKGGTIPATGHGDAIAVSETVSTCSTHGLKFHFHCDACGGDYLEKGVAAVAQKLEDLQLPLNPQNHEETELRNASEATCEADGYTGDFHCSGCGEKLEEGKTVPGGHTVENGICTRCEAYGTCGENLTWTYENGTLTISGEGEMYDYSTEANPENAPWAYYLEEVKTIVIEEGVTSVGHQAFSGLFAVTEVSLPDTLTTIGGSAFFNCVALEEIVIPANVTAIGDSAFTFCYALTEITFDGSAPAIGNEAFGLVTANVHYTPDAGWTADVKQNYGGTLTWDSYVTYVAMIGSVGYATVAEALAAVQPGDKVQLLKDTFESDVVLPKGIALDLNGNVLEADYIFAVNGANIVDESEDNTGLLKADADCVLISKGNAQLPIWNGEGYVFTKVTYHKALAAHNEDMVKFAFLPMFQSVATELLKDGFEGNKVTVEVRVSWETIQGREYRNLVFNNKQVALGISSGGAFILTFSGFSQLNLTTDVAIEAVVYSETGVSVASEAIVVDVTEKPAPTDPLEIVKDAYALAGGEELPYNPVTLTGTISKVNYPWSDQYGDITVTIYIDEDTSKEYPIECYRMVSSGEEMDEAIKTLAVGDTVTVKGTLMKYQNDATGATKVEFNNPELIAFTDNTTEEPEEVLDTPEKIVNAAYALAEGESLEGTYSLTGKVLSVDTPYDPDYDNITVTIQIGDMTDKPIKCYRMKGEGAAELKAGDIITVTGILKNYYSTIEFDAACTFVMVEKAPEVPEDTETETVKIAFDNKAKRTSFSTEQQVWEENGITVTNDKAGSSSDVADYANPVRFYKSSKLTVEYTGMTKLEFACGESKYATALKSSINVAGATVTVSGSVVTVELSAAADSFVIESLTGGQVRVSSITMTTG